MQFTRTSLSVWLQIKIEITSISHAWVERVRKIVLNILLFCLISMAAKKGPQRPWRGVAPGQKKPRRGTVH